jgi:hypothetical protein
MSYLQLDVSGHYPAEAKKALAGDEMYHPTLGDYSPEWSPGEPPGAPGAP